MAKDLKSILAGVKSSKIAPPEIDDKNMYQWNAKDGVAFIKKHKIEIHADRVGNGDDVYKGKTKKTDKYKFQSDGVYEESEEEEDELDEGNKENKAKKKAVMADKPKEKEKEFDPREFFSAARRGRQMEENFDGMKSLKSQIGLRSPKALAAFVKNKKDKKLGEGAGCNHTMEGVMCEVHGESACPTKENDVNMQKPKKKDSKGREYLADKKKVMDEASQYRSTYGMGKRGWASSKAGKVTFQDKAYLPSGPKKEELRAAAEKANASGVKVTKLPAGKAKGIKEEVQYIEEVLTAKDPVSTWIHHFVHSKNPKFEGKSTKQRQQMALGAYYDKKRGVKESGSATNTDYAGPGAAGWTTGRHDMGTL